MISGITTESLARHWQDQWETALAVWSRYTRLRPPIFCHSDAEARNEGLSDSFAMIRFHDQSIVINLQDIARRQIGEYALEILAHEIGHHVLAPGNPTDHARIIARVRQGLPTLEQHAPMIANLYTDLLINNQLQRSANLRMDEVFLRLAQASPDHRLWALYMRIYEILWQHQTGALGGYCDNAAMEGDAWLGARLVRVYARDWLAGAGSFAALFLPYLIADEASPAPAAALMDTRHAGVGDFPGGLVTLSEQEMPAIVHPARDPRLSDLGEQDASGNDKCADEKTPSATYENTHAAGQYREPFAYGELLRAAGIELSDHEIAIRYYRERALPYLIRFPRKRQPERHELSPEGTTVWEVGDAMEQIDWFQTLMTSPVVIPGVTTRQRVWGDEPSPERRWQLVDLDLYVDCSGSMPNPQTHTSYTALAGAVLCLSALRAGASVQVTLWSGAREFASTDGFTRDEQAILRILTGYFGGATAFPIHVLRDTHATKHKRDVHIVILSDDGVTTLFDRDEKGNAGWDVAAQALACAGGGGTLVLNLPFSIDDTQPGHYWQEHARWLRRARDEQHWAIHRVTDWEEMVAFARAFGQQHYASGGRS